MLNTGDTEIKQSCGTQGTPRLGKEDKQSDSFKSMIDAKIEHCRNITRTLNVNERAEKSAICVHLENARINISIQGRKS